MNKQEGHDIAARTARCRCKLILIRI